MISVVVPIFNEEELIMRFHQAMVIALNSANTPWEVVYVNDGSTDFSLQLLRGLQSIDSHVVVVELSRNWGHMGAISAGIQTARRQHQAPAEKSAVRLFAGRAGPPEKNGLWRSHRPVAAGSAEILGSRVDIR